METGPHVKGLILLGKTSWRKRFLNLRESMRYLLCHFPLLGGKKARNMSNCYAKS